MVLAPGQQVPAELGRVARRRERLGALARLALAAGEVEVGPELARLPLVPIGEQHEAVRLEQVTQVDVRKQATVRRVTCALEGVQLMRGDRVDGRDLVDHEDATAGPRDANELGDHELRPRNVVESAERPRQVERRRLERELRRVALDELDVRRALRTPAALLEQLGNEVDRDHLANVARKRERKRAGAAAGVERALLTTRRGEPHDLRLELRRARVLQRGDPVSRPRESLLCGVLHSRAPPPSWRSYRRPAPPRSRPGDGRPRAPGGGRARRRAAGARRDPPRSPARSRRAGPTPRHTRTPRVPTARWRGGRRGPDADRRRGLPPPTAPTGSPRP